MAARTDRRVTYSFWLLLGEMVCPEGKRPCAGVSPLTPPVLPDRCRVCRARSLLKGLSSGLADPDRQVPRSSLRAPSPSVKQRRSEERRVGKEGGSRGRPDDDKKRETAKQAE